MFSTIFSTQMASPDTIIWTTMQPSGSKTPWPPVYARGYYKSVHGVP